MVALDVEQDSLMQSLASRDAKLEGPQMTEGAKTDFFELLIDHMEQQTTSSEKAKAELDTRFAKDKAQPEAALSEMSTQTDHLGDKEDLLSSDRSVFNWTVIRRIQRCLRAVSVVCRKLPTAF